MLTSLSIVLAVALGVSGAQPVEHWRAGSGDYALTFYPGFASRAYIEEANGKIVELYRQDGSFKLPDGETAAAAKHQLRLNGASLDGSVALSIKDPKHDIAEVRVALYTGSTLVVENHANTCPPICLETKATFTSRMIADAGRFDALQTAVSARGYDVAFYGGFASRITSSVGGELFRQSKAFHLGDAAKAGRHEVRIAGGPAKRDIAIGIADGEHQVESITLHLYDENRAAASESIEIKNRAVTCPPDC